MVRVLLAVGGGGSHLYPLVPLAWALRTIGHEVIMAGTSKLTVDITRAGLPAVAVGHGPRLSDAERRELLQAAYGQPPWPTDWPAHPDRLDAPKSRFLEVMGRYVIAVADGLTDDLVAFARHWRPDLVVYDTIALAGAIAAARIGVPGVRYAHGTHEALRLELTVPGGEPLPGYTRLCQRAGLAAAPRATAYIDTLPASMDIGREPSHLDMRWVPYNGPAMWPDELTGPRRRPRVCVTWGLTVPGALGGATDVYRDTIAAIASSGAEALVLTSHEQAGRLGELPAGTRHLVGVALLTVLPYCDAIVHHGGDGSTMTAAALGVTQLLITREPNDALNGGRVAATGVGIHLRHQHLPTGAERIELIRTAVRRLLSEPRYGEAARRLRDEIQEQRSPVDVATILAELTTVDSPQ